MVLLDAYDAKGRVPPHLRAPPFLRALGASLAPGALVIANLWYATSSERVEADAFVDALHAAACTTAFGLRVVGHEKNRILVAVARDAEEDVGGAGQARRAVEGRLQDALRSAAAEHARLGTEAALVATMRGNAGTLEAWAGAD